MSFDIGAFGWHGTVFVGWGSLVVVGVVMLAAGVLAKVLIARAG